LPRDAAVAVGQGLHAGIQKMAEKYEVDLVGGDTNAWAGPLVISVTVLGEMTSRGPVLRAGARPGDVIMVTGPLGGSLHRGRHLRPEPRIREALALHEITELTAMIDISDGLSSDLPHILEESGELGAILDADSIPIHPDALDQSQGDGISAIEHALNDGEDFELCLTIAPELARKVLENPPESVTLYPVGVVTPDPGLRLRDSGGQIVIVHPRGFDHFRDAGSSRIP
jgi:thiamine-monophosphate kinase